MIVGKTVTHEFAAGVLSPPTRNPWDPSRIPGGSSGGSGAAVAAGSCLAALGTDTAGSIRVPAALNGVVGFKPTCGRVSTRGVFPLSWSLDTVGPLAKTVDDAMLVLDAIAGRCTSNRGGGSAASGTTGGNLRGMRLGIPRPYFFDRVQPDVAAAVEAAIGLLADLGAEVMETPWPEARAASAAGFVLVRPRWPPSTPRRCGHAGAIRAGATRSPRGVFTLPGQGYLRAGQARTAVRRTMADLFLAHRLDALVMPTVAATATPADRMMIAYRTGRSRSTPDLRV